MFPAQARREKTERDLVRRAVSVDFVKKRSHRRRHRHQHNHNHAMKTAAGDAVLENVSSFSFSNYTSSFSSSSDFMCELRTDVDPSKIVSSHELESKRVLVLDVAMQTSNIVSWQRGLLLAAFDKVDVLEYYEHMVASAYRAFYVPAVVKTRVYDKKAGKISLSRKNLIIRDQYTCQYCGTHGDLTVDHIVPASKGGEWSWTNLTTACAKCNNRKGDKLLKHCSGMKLRKEPKEPNVKNGEFCQYSRIVNPPDEWIPFIPESAIRMLSIECSDLDFGDASVKNNPSKKKKTAKKKK